MYVPPPGTSTCPPPAAVQASIAFWIAAVLSVTPSAFAPYAVTSNVRADAQRQHAAAKTIVIFFIGSTLTSWARARRAACRNCSRAPAHASSACPHT